MTHKERVLNIKVTVCDNCFRASCWMTFFMCEDNFKAGTTEKTIGDLKELKREHPSYFKLSLV